MKIFAIIYLFGNIVGYIGPWPENSMNMCIYGMKQMEIKHNEIFLNTEILKLSNGKETRKNDWKFSCEILTETPIIKENKENNENK